MLSIRKYTFTVMEQGVAANCFGAVSPCIKGSQLFEQSCLFFKKLQYEYIYILKYTCSK